MEEQNQQPIQEKRETKPPVKTKWKFIAIVVAVGLALGGGVFLLARIQSLQSPQSPFPQLPRQQASLLQILPEDQKCETDTDCVIVNTDCSYCECGVPVNKIYQTKYETQYKELCKNYRAGNGGICDFLCETPLARCITNKCTLSANPSQVDLTKGWQTYRSEEFGFEVGYPKEYYAGEISAVNGIDFGIRIGHRIIDENILLTFAVRKYDLSEQWCKGDFYQKGGYITVGEKSKQKCLEPEFGGYHQILSYSVLVGKHNGFFFDFTCHRQSSTLCDQILSTFRFVGKKPVIPADKKSCEAKGGVWERLGLAQVWRCNLPTSDAGKECTDSSQCESACIFDETRPDLEPPPGSNVQNVGKCYEWTETLGTCLNYVTNGKAQGTICAY